MFTLSRSPIDENKFYRLKLIDYASTWVGTREDLGENRSHKIDRLADEMKVPHGSAWCALLAQHCLKRLESEINIKSGIFNSANCKEIWDKTDIKYRIETPDIGDLIIWSFGGNAGHIGIIMKILEDNERGLVIEGNTTDPLRKEPQGCYIKNRYLLPRERRNKNDMILTGYLRPFLYGKEA